MPMSVQQWKRQVYITVSEPLYHQIQATLEMIDSGDLNDEEGRGRFLDLVGHLLPPDHNPITDHTHFVVERPPTFQVPREFIN